MAGRLEDQCRVLAEPGVCVGVGVVADLAVERR